MSEPLSFEVKAEDRQVVEEVLAKHSDEVEVIEARNLTGFEVFLLMLKFGPGAVSAGVAIYNLIRGRNKTVTVVLPDGKRIENVTQEQLEKLLKEADKNGGNS